MICLMTSSAIHIGLTLLFVNVFELGFLGVCIATSMMFVSRFLIVLIQIETNPKLKNIYDVKFFSKETIENVGSQFKLGLFGLFMGVWGWWAFDIFTLIASYLSIEEVSA